MSRLDGGRQIGFLWGAVSILMLALSPFAPPLASSMPPCVFHELTGHPCLTCGGTRAAVALARLDPVTALRANPLVAVGLVALVGGGLLAGFLALLGHGVREPARYPGWVRLVCVLALAANWAFLILAGRAP